MQQIQFAQDAITPSKVICVGRNYVEHIHELNNEIPAEMVLFIKPNSAISTQLQAPEGPCRFEAEICFVLVDGKIAGVGFGLDLTLADVQNRLKSKSLPWEKSKAFDGAAVFSDFVPFDGVTHSLRLLLEINGTVRQQGGVELMMYRPAEILKEVQAHFSCEDGDIIMTGTPKGVGELNAGDRYKGSIFDGETLLLEQEWLVAPHKKGVL